MFPPNMIVNQRPWTYLTPELESPKMICRVFLNVSTNLTERVPRVVADWGLAIAKHTVQAHGGTISVKSEEGKGSTLSFNLPINPDMDQQNLKFNKNLTKP